VYSKGMDLEKEQVQTKAGVVAPLQRKHREEQGRDGNN